ncbi:hypothetical protein RJ55_07456 [Drechmeria coniospora]|nr:hypothetical protein RJ55_07456 [Drechmeria coniospora]
MFRQGAQSITSCLASAQNFKCKPLLLATDSSKIPLFVDQIFSRLNIKKLATMGYFSASAVDGRSSVGRPFLSDESGERVIQQVDERKVARLKRVIVAFGVVIVSLVVICFALVNMLRKRLYSKQDYAPDHELMGIEHLEHCYDALRQSLMCSADITPLPWQWVEAAQESKEVAQVAHTCRDFDAIKTWAKEREVVHFDRKTYVPDDLDA